MHLLLRILLTLMLFLSSQDADWTFRDPSIHQRQNENRPFPSVGPPERRWQKEHAEESWRRNRTNAKDHGQPFDPVKLKSSRLLTGREKSWRRTELKAKRVASGASTLGGNLPLQPPSSSRPSRKLLLKSQTERKLQYLGASQKMACNRARIIWRLDCLL